jgi:acyl-homoserine-lactone acylase
MSRRLVALVAAAIVAGGIAPAVASASAPKYDVTITRTEYGIPHITARDFGSLGYGYAYAFAQDDFCVMENDYVTVEGLRSKYFGPTGTYTMPGNGTTVSNLDSDVFWTQMRQSGVVDKLLAEKGVSAPLPGITQAIQGYVDGWNRYLSDVGGANGIKDPACHGAPWVQPITLETMYLRLYQLVLLADYDVAIGGIAEAAPPAAGAPVSAPLSPAETAQRFATAWKKVTGDLGSNAIAIGSEGTRDHTHGMLLGNPHFPWVGDERFYQAQMTIPGVVNVSGASLLGVPIILIGYNKNIAWSHTVSTAYRFTPYQLTLVPGDPTSYLYDGVPTKMQPHDVTVTVKNSDGSLSKVTKTTWWTRYGPVFTSLVGLPFPWTPATAFAMRGVNADNFRVFNHFLATNMATSTADELGILKKYQGIPWVNTIVSDRTGHALYADIGAIPNVPNSLAQQCDTALGAALFQLVGLPVLDGSRSSCNWLNDPDAAVPGTFGPSHEPYLSRSDYVTNSNDSYWLSNPAQPLTGYARIIGDEGTPRSLRTRIGLIMTQQRISGVDGQGPPGFTLQDLQNLVFSDRQYAGEMMRDPLVSLCRSLPGVAPTSSGAPVPLGNACDVLASWDLHENLTSRGAILFRRFLDNLFGSTQATAYGYAKTYPFYSTPFSASDAVRTPAGLNTADPEVAVALGNAIDDLDKAGYPLDVPVGQVQYVVRNGVKIPIHGGVGDPNGQFNAVDAAWTASGLAQPDFGSSYVQAVTWDDSPCPIAETILTYSQSTDPTNPHYADQTQLFSQKKWVKNRFCAADIAAAPDKVVTHLVGQSSAHSPARSSARSSAKPGASSGSVAPGRSAGGSAGGSAAAPAGVTSAAALPAASVEAARTSGTLPFTGLDAVWPATGVLLLAGAALLTRRRRRAPAAHPPA